MKQKSEVMQAVKQFAKEVGAPDAIVCDMASKQTSAEVKQFCNTIGTTLRALEEGTPWANKAELYIKLMKEAVHKDMRVANSPLPFWDYCLEHRVRIYNMMACDNLKIRGTNPHTATLGVEGNISNLCQYSWYDWYYYCDQIAKFPHNQEVLGCVLGPAHGEGNEMAQWVLKANGNVVPRHSLRPLQTTEIYSNSEKKIQLFDKLVYERHGDSINVVLLNMDRPVMEKYEDEDESARPIPDIEETVDANGHALNQLPAYDRLLNAEVQLQYDDHVTTGKVKCRALGPDGNMVGKYDNNPMLNSIMYEVEFADMTVKEYGANIIAENMLRQVDSEGFSLALMEGIVDFRCEELVAIPIGEKYIITKTGQKHLRKMTAGWDLLVCWKDESESWVKLSDMKESHPVEMAEFTKANGIQGEPAFCWWVPYTLRKRDTIMAAVGARIWKTTHKYGVEIPKDVHHAWELDKRNENTMWMDALAKEMFNAGIAFEVLEDKQSAPPGWSKVTGHLVWDVKMDFT